MSFQGAPWWVQRVGWFCGQLWLPYSSGLCGVDLTFSTCVSWSTVSSNVKWTMPTSEGYSEDWPQNENYLVCQLYTNMQQILPSLSNLTNPPCYFSIISWVEIWVGLTGSLLISTWLWPVAQCLSKWFLVPSVSSSSIWPLFFSPCGLST